MTDTKHNILPVLEHYGLTNIRESWGWQKVRCIFHEDSRASASVNINDNVFVCHGCGIKGDTYKVIMEKEGLDFREAYIFAEGISGKSDSTVQEVRASGRRVLSTPGADTARRGYRPPRGRRRTAT